VTFAALTNETIGWTIFIVILIGVVTYTVINILRGAKPELGSEIELAPNRKPYLDDEALEGKKLDRALTWGLVTLFIIAIGLPMYWIYEPGRQANASTDFNETFVKRGAAMFAPTGESLDALNCSGCHGGMKAQGGTVAYNLTNPDGTITPVNWRAPALNTVLLRYSRQEVTFIITYGRPFSPMPAWGVTGGGALNDQQVQNLVDYLESIQLTPADAQQQARDELTKMMAEKNPDGTPKYASEGEALFNMGIDSDNFAGGAYSCARCHTQGWSYATSYDQVKAVSGCGALGPSLCGGSAERQFPAKPGSFPCTPADSSSSGSSSSSSSSSGSTSSAPPPCTNPFQDQIDFVGIGSEEGKRYGVHGQGSGKMPGFGQRPAEPAVETFAGSPGLLFWINGGKDRPAGPGMLPTDLIEQIVVYERSLQ
jgi:mono/diheme cytochrome c family protein